MSQYLIKEIHYQPRISVQPCAVVVDGGGEGRLEWIDVRDLETEEVQRQEVRGLFLMLGAEPHCTWLPARGDAGRARLRAHRPRRAEALVERRTAAGQPRHHRARRLRRGRRAGRVDEAGRVRLGGGRERRTAGARATSPPARRSESARAAQALPVRGSGRRSWAIFRRGEVGAPQERQPGRPRPRGRSHAPLDPHDHAHWPRSPRSRSWPPPRPPEPTRSTRQSSTRVPITCDNGHTYDAVVNGNGQFSPAHDVNSRAVLVPTRVRRVRGDDHRRRGHRRRVLHRPGRDEGEVDQDAQDLDDLHVHLRRDLRGPATWASSPSAAPARSRGS